MNVSISNGQRFLAAQQSTFPGGETFVRLLDDGEFHSQARNRYTIHARVKSADDLFAIALYKDALERAVPGCEVSLFMPYVPYARQDRVCYRGESLSICVLAKFINGLEFRRVGIVDPHSDVTPALLDRCLVQPQSSIVCGWHDLRELIHSSILLSPDVGALKKSSAIAKYCKSTGFETAEKVRDAATGEIVSVRIARAFDRDTVVCCDDICDGGRTFIELAKVAKSMCAGRFVLYVTHGIFSKGVDVLFESGIDEIWTTNSLSESYDPRVKVRDIFNPAGVQAECALTR